MSFESDLYYLISQQLPARVAALELGSNLPSGIWWAFKLPANSIEGIVTVSGFTGDYWAITENTIATPTWPDDYTWGVPPATYVMQSLLAWTASQRLRFWQYRDGTHTEIMDINGASGILVTAIVSDAPIPITDLVITNGTTPQTDINYSFTGTTVIDGLTVLYDMVDLNGDGTIKQTVDTEISAGSGSITGLAPGTTYNFSVKAYPSGVIDGTRDSFSNIDEHTTASSGVSIDSFNVNDFSGTSPYSAVIGTFTSTGANEWFYRLNDDTPPTVDDTGWGALPTPGVSTVTAPGVGLFNIYAWARNSTNKPNISDMETDTFTVVDTSSGVPTFSFNTATISFTETNAPTVTIPVTRSDDTSGANTVDVVSSELTTQDAAFNGVHYQTVSTTLSYAASDTSKNVSIELLWANLGHSNGVPEQKRFLLTLTNQSAGVIGNQGTIEVIIKGNNGYISGSEIDVNHPPVDLTPSAPLSITTNSTTVSGKHIDATGSDFCISIANGVSNVTIENCILENANRSAIKCANAPGLTVRNCVMRECNKDIVQLDNAAVFMNGHSGVSSATIKLLSNYVSGVMRGFIMHWLTTATNIKCSWNYHIDQTGSRGVNLPTPSYGCNHIAQIYGCSGSNSFQIYGNVNYVPTGYLGGFDVINIGHNGITAEVNRGYIIGNFLDGASITSDIGKDSGGGIIQDGPIDGSGYWTARFNTCIDTGNFALSITAGRNIIFEDNDCYTAQNSDDVNVNGVGVSIWRIAPPPGAMHSCEFSRNRILWYKGDVANPIKHMFWYPSTGSDGNTPNHGTLTTGNVAPTGMSPQTNVDMTSWDNGAGDQQVKGRKAVLKQNAWGDGIWILWADYNCPTGTGILRWDQSASTLTFTSYSDQTGSTVTIDTTSSAVWDGWYNIPSATTGGIQVCILADDLPSIDTAYYVPVTGHLVRDVHIYPGSTGEWTGVSRISGAGSGTAPSVPVISTATSASETSVTITLTGASTSGGSGVGGYYWYRDGIKVGETVGSTSTSYTDTGLTTGQSYSYTCASYDGSIPPVVSEQSAPVTGTPAAAGTNILSNGEFNTAISGSDWTASNATTSVTSGVIRLTNDGTGTGHIYQTPTGLPSASTVYNLDLKHLGSWETPSSGYRQARVCISSDSVAPNSVWFSSDTGAIKVFNVSDSVWTETNTTFTKPVGVTGINVVLWINDNSASNFTEFDFIRIYV